jgi:hypothetical protein
MNSIIRELAIEAGFPKGGFDKDGVVIQNSKEIEKFATLVVTECATLADTAEPYKAHDLIKRYFGVK